MASYLISPIWTLERTSYGLLFKCCISGVEVEVEVADEAASAVASLPAHGKPLSHESLRHPSHEAIETLRELEALGIVVPTPEEPAPDVIGKGEFADYCRTNARFLSWTGITSVRLCQNATDDRFGSDITVMPYRGGVIGLRSRDDWCLGCAQLRIDGALGCPGTGREHTSQEIGFRLLTTIAAELSDARQSWAPAVWAIQSEGVQKGPVIAHPDCKICSGFASATSNESQSEETGKLIRKSTEESRQVIATGPFAPGVLYETTATPGILPLDLPLVWGDVRLVRSSGGKSANVGAPAVLFGSGDTLEGSRLIALSELAERHAALSVRPQRFEAPPTKQDLERAGRILPFIDVSTGAVPGAWVEARELTSNEIARVPFEAVAVDPPAEIFGRLALYRPFFTGTASHTTFPAALNRAAVEVIVRDAYVRAWREKARLNPISLEVDLTPRASALQNYLSSKNLTVSAFKLPTAAPVSALVIRVVSQEDQRQWPKGGSILVPAGGHCYRSAYEHALSFASMRYITIASSLAETRGSDEATDTVWSSISHYLDPMNAGPLDRFCSLELPPYFATSHRSGKFNDNEAVQSLVDHFQQTGHEFFVVRLTDAVSSAAGFEVVKAIISEHWDLSALMNEPTASQLRSTFAYDKTQRQIPLF